MKRLPEPVLFLIFFIILNLGYPAQQVVEWLIP